jgi:cation diffusion facilitator family transporter
MNRAARTARLSILSNCVLIAMKIVVGLVSGSVSIISEAIHSFMDLAAAVMAFFSIRVAERPADDEHPYGHGKIENVSGVLEAGLILVAAGLIIAEAVKKLVTHESVEHLELGVAVMLISGIVNILVSRRLYTVARKEESVALEADALHLKTDVYTSLGVGLGLLLIVVFQRAFHAGWASYLDPIVAIAVAIFILREAWLMLRKAFAPLVDASISPQELSAIEAEVAAYPGVALHDIRTRRSGKTKHIDFHLTAPESMSVKESHELCDEIERRLEKGLSNTSVLIHIEPAIRPGSGRNGGDDERMLSKDELLSRIDRLGREVSGHELRVHHLHLFTLAGRTEITFHIDVDSTTSVEEAHRLASTLESRVHESLGYEATVHVEPRRAL